MYGVATNQKFDCSPNTDPWRLQRNKTHRNSFRTCITLSSLHASNHCFNTFATRDDADDDHNDTDNHPTTTVIDHDDNNNNNDGEDEHDENNERHENDADDINTENNNDENV